MTETSPNARRPSFSLWTVFVWLTATAIPLGWFSIFCVQVRRAVDGFAPRHSEATGAIESVYAFYDRNGRWPENADMAPPGQHWLPPDWTYDFDPANGIEPRLFLHGPYHLFLDYRFEAPRQGVASRDWDRCWEGDHKYFKSDASYSVPGTKSPQPVSRVTP